jgi:starch phosphorylase
MKGSMASLGGFVTADRMVRDYVKELYEPAAAQERDMCMEDYARAKALAEWKAKLSAGWDEIEVIDVEGDLKAAEVGEERVVGAVVRLGALSTDDIAVQLAHGRVGASGEIVEPHLIEMTADHCVDGTCVYRGKFSTEDPGLYGFAVRVIPSHPDLTNPLDMGLLAWA